MSGGGERQGPGLALQQRHIEGLLIDDIDALLATVQFSSLNQAAEYLGITQSAITRRLQRLEQTLNVTLLEGSQQGINVIDTHTILNVIFAY
jgi:hypothetical protein